MRLDDHHGSPFVSRRVIISGIHVASMFHWHTLDVINKTQSETEKSAPGGRVVFSGPLPGGEIPTEVQAPTAGKNVQRRCQKWARDSAAYLVSVA